MENDQTTSAIATALLNQIYNDYKREKRLKTIFRVFYIFIFSVIIGMYSMGKNQSIKPPVQPSNYVAVIELDGNIGDEDLNYKKVIEKLKKAFEDPLSKGIILDIESPGGVVYDCHMIYQELQKLKQAHPEKKITSYIRSTGASAAYWLATTGNQIYASETSIVGSIGVLMMSANISGFLEEHKIEPVILKSGPHKLGVNPFTKNDPQDLMIAQDQVNAIFDMFKDVVKANRGNRLKNDPSIFSGRVWLGVEAIKLGLIDKLSDFDAMVSTEYSNLEVKYVLDAPENSLDKILNEAFKRLSLSHHLLDFKTSYGLLA